MDATFVPPDTVLKILTCATCNNILSVPPIMIISKDGDLYRCGRCKNGFAGTPLMRNFLYEMFAECVSFPCIYANCPEKIKWGLVEAHEKICTFRTIECQNCPLQILVSEIKSHFIEHHKPKLRYRYVCVDLKPENDYIGLVITENLPFIVYVLKYLEFFIFCVFAIEPLNEYTSFDVLLSSRKHHGFSAAYRSQKIIQFDGRRHCYKCIKKSCLSTSHPYSQAYYNITDVKYFCANFEEQSKIYLPSPDAISCTIRLNKGSNEAKEVLQKNLDVQFGLQNNRILLRHHLTCSICVNYMTPPIYSCKTGHSFCNICKVLMKNCPSCKAEFMGTRNYDLEAISENVELPCQYKDHGCSFMGNTEKVRTHEVDCSMKT